eukprot:CAMPEP_0172360248 /NCGR_PEP_ID=MMETSP1060-20121228/4327_1 /TAXON_ID=37318 /ORGANISM="Pseudo-nitzschia pungens, Strain cf. cingulata" /LENGTH=352 /DNA_ID=CAMNT_0013082203 /DNA_START=140 /DNA_END=1198 /DNA_ORIENTATION=-
MNRKFQRRYTIANDDISFDVENQRNYTNDQFAKSEGTLHSTGGGKDDYIIQQGILSDVGSESFLPRLWKIKDKDVTELPEIYPRLSSPLIFRDCEISTIGDSLFDFLKVNSVRSVYDSQRARIFCYTNRASFVVQFWRRKIPDNNNLPASLVTPPLTNGEEQSANNELDGKKEGTSSEEIILEVQRRQGCSYAMHKIRTALNKSIHSETSSSSTIPKTKCSDRRSIVRYERLLLEHQDQPFKRPSLEEMTTTRKRTRWSEFLSHPPPSKARRRSSMGNICHIDTSFIDNKNSNSNSSSSASLEHQWRNSSNSTDSLINKSIFIAAAIPSDPSNPDNSTNNSSMNSSFGTMME